MSYKVLIVDDEEIMRDGLANLVKWKTMGFEIADKLEDGQDAIEYIKTHQVDVILTDIKMTFVSGLDVAKYVYDNNLNIKVVLISGYKEFEFAQKAISYNVVHYLLKPVKFKDISDVFIQIKEQLDMAYQNKMLEIQKSTQIDELMMFSRKQFFVDAGAGMFSSKTDVIDRMKLLDFKFDILYNKCSTLDICINDFDKFVKENWSYNKEGLLNAVRNFFVDTGGLMQYYDIGTQSNILRFIAIQMSINGESFEEELNRQLNDIRLGINALLGINISIASNNTFDSILDMAVSPNNNNTDNQLLENYNNVQTGKQEKEIITRIKKYISEHLNKDITLEDVAEYVFLSPVYLSRMFKEQSGEYFSDYIVKAKMDKAAELLKNPNYKVYDVGYMVGYSNTKYFYKIFKRCKGCTPTEYRNNGLIDGADKFE